MLHRVKRRYILLLGIGNNDKLEEAIILRHAELFGVVATSGASIKFIKQNQDLLIFRCTLASIQDVIVSISMLGTPLLVLGISGSLRRLCARSRQINDEN